MKKRKKISKELKENSKWGYIEINTDGHIRFSDPTKDDTDPNSGHTGGYKTIGLTTSRQEEYIKKLIKQHIYQMKKDGVVFYNESTDEIYSVKEIYDMVLNPQERIFFRAILPK